MDVSKDKLLALLSQMTKNEKRHFVLFSNSFNKSEKSYMHLFNILDNNNLKKKSDIESELADLGISTPLATLKNYLYEKIMSALIFYHKDSFAHSKIFDAVSKAALLKSKGLYEEASNLLKKVKKTPEFNKSINKSLVYEQEYKLDYLFESFEPNVFQNLVTSLTRWQEELSVINQYIEVEKLKTQSIIDFNNSAKNKEEKNKLFQERLKHPSLNTPSDSSRVKHSQVLLKELLYTLLNNSKQHYESSKELFELQIKSTKTPNRKLINSWSRYLSACIKANKPDEFLQIWNVFDKKTFKDPKTKFSYLYRKYYRILEFGIQFNQVDIVFKNEKDIYDFIKNHKDNFNHVYMRLYACFAVCYLINQQYDKGLEILNEWLLYNKISFNQIEYFHIKILEIIFYIELNEFNTTSSKLNTFKRQLKRLDVVSEERTMVIKHFSKISQTNLNIKDANKKEKALHEIYKALLKEIKEHNLDDLPFNHVFIITNWLNNKL